MDYTKKTLIALIALSLLLPWSLFNSLELYSLSLLFAISGAILLWWQYFLGARGLIARAIPDLIWINNLHKRMGKYGFLLILMHPALIIASYGNNFATILLPNLEDPFSRFVLLGQIAFILLLSTWLGSAFFRNYISYRWWKRFHYFNYLILPLVLVHSINLGTNINTYPWLRSLWLFMLITYVLLVFFRLLSQFGLGKGKYQVVEKRNITSNVVEFTYKHISGPKLDPKPGQFAYISTSWYGETHPFTISNFDEAKGEVSQTIKSAGYFTNLLHNTLNVGDYVRLEGPWGVFTQSVNNVVSPVVLIAGGIGVTPFYSYLQHSFSPKGKAVYLFYANRTSQDIAYFNELEDLAKRNSNFTLVNVLSEEKNDSFEQGYVTIELLKKYIKHDISQCEFAVCGPPIMLKTVTNNLLSEGVPSSKIATEKFSL